jgi:hypothetical protein
MNLELNGRVTWAHVTERVDPRPHIRAHELVCTVGTALINPQDSIRFANAVHESGASGICLGLGEVHTKPPRALVQEANRLKLPLLEMRHGVPFIAINDVVVKATIGTPAALGASTQALLTEMLEGVRTDRTTTELLAVASSRLGGTLVRELRGADERSSTAGRVTAALDNGEILVWQGGELADSSVIEQVAGIVQIAERAAHERVSAARQRLGQLFTLVGDGLAHASALSRELQSAGMDGAEVIVSAWPAGTADLVANRVGDAMVAELASMVILVTRDVVQIRDTADALGLVCGYSSAVAAQDLERAINEARAALVLARSRGSVAGPENLTSLTALLEQQPLARLEPFVEHLIQPLIDADGRRNSSLLTTLRAFLQHGSVKETATRCYLHVNTVRHRLGRIAQLTGRDPLDRAELVDLTIALWTFDRVNRRQGANARPLSSIGN